jgi:hypothetical protein
MLVVEARLAKFKGTVFVSTRMFTESRFGPEAVERIYAALGPADRDVLAQITTVGWYPVEPVLAYHHALDRLYGRGDLALCVEVGKFSAGWAVNTILKFLLRFRSPHWIFEKAGSVWSHYHDTGRWEFDAQGGEKKICGRLHDFAVNDPAFCARLRGWVSGAVELTGGRNAQVVESRCTTRGQAFHEYTGTWE